MRQIHKQAEPRELRAHRLAGGGFEDPQGESRWKERLQEALLRDQGAICCYCMRRIHRESMKVEHHRCQERHPERALDYDNLFGACPGNPGQPWTRQTCDSRKGNADLTLIPSGNIEPFLRYLADGTITSDNPDYQRDLDVTLNLNVAELTRARRSVQTGLIAALHRRMPGEWKTATLQAELERWQQRDAHGNYHEYCQVAAHLLRRRLRRA